MRLKQNVKKGTLNQKITRENCIWSTTESDVSGIKPRRWAMNSSWRTLVFDSIWTQSIAEICQKAIKIINIHSPSPCLGDFGKFFVYSSLLLMVHCTLTLLWVLSQHWLHLKHHFDSYQSPNKRTFPLLLVLAGRAVNNFPLRKFLRKKVPGVRSQ